MPKTAGPKLAVPDTGWLAFGDRPSLRRILVPLRVAGDAAEPLAVAARVCCPATGVLHLVHVRVFDPPLRAAGRFYPETRTEAAAVTDQALLIAWGYGLPATTAVVDAPRGEVASAIAQQASAWRADVIMMTRRASPAIWRLLKGSVSDQVIRQANCPVLTIHPRAKAQRNTSR
jgi:nucleotide-binding universal stress UspA family protein